jgi:hypothetical protein
MSLLLADTTCSTPSINTAYNPNSSQAHIATIANTAISANTANYHIAYIANTASSANYSIAYHPNHNPFNSHHSNYNSNNSFLLPTPIKLNH